MTSDIPLRITLADLNDPEQGRALLEIIDAYAQEPHGGGLPLPTEVRERIIPGLKSAAGFVLLAWDDGVPVGAAVCFWGFSTFAGRPLANVHDLSVLASHRGRGIGTRLLASVEDHVRSRGGSKITLEVRLANPQAERLYHRLGFRPPSGFETRFLEKSLPPSNPGCD